MTTNFKDNQRGFVMHAMVAVLLVALFVLGTLAYLNIKKQNQAKDQQLATANQRIDSLQTKQKIPDDWKRYTLSNGGTVTLPNNYQQTEVINGTYIFKVPGKVADNENRVDIAVHTNDAAPASINNHVFAYDTYCRFNGTVWEAFKNSATVQGVDDNAANIALCAKVTPKKSSGVDYYMFEDMTKDSDHIAAAVKTGTNYFVLNYEKYFNNYGIEAIKAVSTDQNKAMEQLVQKIAAANR